MENKNDIGKAFRDKLNGLHKQPNNAVWDAIKADLPKKERRFLPLFFKEATTAVRTIITTLLLSLLIALTYLVVKENSSTNHRTEPAAIITNSNLQTKDSSGKSTNSQTDVQVNNNSNASLNKSNGSSATVIPTDNNNQETGKGKNVTKINSATVLTKSSSNNGKTWGYRTQKTANSSKDKPIANGNKNTINKHYFTSNSNKRSSDKTNNLNTAISGNGAIAEKESGKKQEDSASNIDTVKNPDIYNATVHNNNAINSEVNDSLTNSNEIKVNEIAAQPVDSLSVAATDSTAVCKDVVAENTTKSDTTATSTFKRFYVFAYAAPANYILKDALLPDALLANNKTSTKISFNYGAYAGFNLNQKLSLRTGISITGFQHTTKNAVLQGTYSVVPGTGNATNDYVHLMPPSNYNNINYTRSGSNAAAFYTLGMPGQNAATVNIIQEIEFAEVPLEVTCKLFDSKFGAKIFAGISTLFTTRNVVYVQNNRGTMWLGSNKNVNNVSFSSTIGLQLFYKISPVLQLNAEPVFKYYFTTFNDGTPYSFGLQAGLQYNFNLFTQKK